MVALLMGTMVLSAAGATLGGASIDGLFLARFSLEYLPYLYVALGLVTFANLIAIAGMLSRIPRRRLYRGLPLLLAVFLLLARVIVSAQLNWFYAVLYVGKDVVIALQSVFLWGLAGALCDARQARRLFPLLTAGSILGAMLGAFATPPLVDALQAENMLLVWSGALLATATVIGTLTGQVSVERRHAQQARQSPLKDWAVEIQQGYGYVRRSALMRWWSVLAVLVSVLWFSLLLPFSRAAAAQFPDAEALASFLGLFQGLQTGAALLVSLFIANRLYARIGLMNTVLLYPVIYLAGFGVLLGYAAFPALVVFRYVQLVWGQSVTEPVYYASFNVVPEERRDQARAFINAVPGQAGIVLAGLILVIGEQVLAPQQLFFIGLAAALLAVAAAWRAKHAYARALVDALRSGQPQLFYVEVEPFGGFQGDAAAVSAVLKGVTSPDPGERQVAVEILGHLRVPKAADVLTGALRDTAAEVRAGALRAVALAGNGDVAPAVAICLQDSDPDVRLQAVSTYAMLGGDRDVLGPHLLPLLADPEPSVRARAALALLRADTGADAQVRAFELLRAMAASAEIPWRAQALAALGEWGDAAAYDLVTAGLGDAAPAVRRAAAEALARIDPGNCIESLVRLWADEDHTVCVAAAAAIGRVGTRALQRTLEALSDPTLEAGALAALTYLPVETVRDHIRTYARDRIRQALHYQDLAGEFVTDADDRGLLLVDSLRVQALRHGLNALRAVGLLGDQAAIATAIANVQSRNANQRAYALETLETLGERDLVRPVLGLWEETHATVHAPHGRLALVMHDPDPWLRACAALAARGSTDPQVREALSEMARSDSDALARDTAAAALNGDTGMKTLPTLSMMDRILFLRRVPLFAGLSPADLKQVAGIATEHYFSDGDAIARLGDPGEEMYIIVSGEVRVLNASNEQIARRKRGEYVGEMAIITQAPRVASLVAAGDVRVLRIGQKQFEGLLRERPETSLAVMRVLCERLKEQM